MQNAKNSTRIYLVGLLSDIMWRVFCSHNIYGKLNLSRLLMRRFFFIYLKSRSVEISQIINLILENSNNENEATADSVV